MHMQIERKKLSFVMNNIKIYRFEKKQLGFPMTILSKTNKVLFER